MQNNFDTYNYMKHIFLVFASILLVCTVSFVLLDKLQEDKLQVQLENKVESVMSQTVTDMELMLYPSLVSSVVLSESDAMIHAMELNHRDKLIDQLVLMAKSYPVLTQVRILDKDGFEYCRVNSSNQGISVVSDNELQDKSKRDYYLNTKDMTDGQIYVSKLEYNMEHGELSFPLEPVIRVIKPIDSESGRLGFLVLNMAFDKMIERLVYPDMPESSGVFFLDSDNRVMLEKTAGDIEIHLATDSLNSQLSSEVKAWHQMSSSIRINDYYFHQKQFQIKPGIQLLPDDLVFNNKDQPLFNIVVYSRVIPVGFWHSIEKIDRTIIVIAILLSVLLLVIFSVGRLQLERRQSLISELNDELIISQAKLNIKKRKLQTLVSTLEHKNKLLKEFSTIVSHNFRSPVSSLGLLVGYFNENYEDMDKAELKEIVGNLNIASKSFNLLAEDLTTTINVLNREELSLQKVNIRRVVDTILLKFDEEVKNSVINFELSAWSFIAYNEEYMLLILDNLFTNAFIYKSKKRTLKISLTTSMINEKMVLQFEDNGQGLDLDLHSNNVFGMHRTFHENSEGRGMGLFLVKLYVENMGGNVFVESKPDVGTKFTLIFGS